MAEFSRLIITKKGHALVAKTLAGGGIVDIKFTRVRTSDESFAGQPVEQLEDLTALTPVKQAGDITSLERINDVAVKVETYFSNTELTEGYYMRTLGLYAEDPDEGEILYAVTTEITGQCWMPAFNSVSVSGAYIQLVTTVGNADHVTIEINPGATATIGDIHKLIQKIEDNGKVIVGPADTPINANDILLISDGIYSVYDLTDDRKTVYYGASSKTVLTKEDVKLLSKKNDAQGEVTFTVTAPAGAFIYFAYPASMGTVRFVVSGFEGGFQKGDDVTFEEAYCVYRSENAGLGVTTVTARIGG